MANNSDHSTDSDSLDAKEPAAIISSPKQNGLPVPPDPSPENGTVLSSISPTMAERLQKKNREWEAAKRKGTPLMLLDLPIDVLRLIVDEYVNCNDLTALAMTHSALYELAVPSMYSRFDIVWPDSSSPAQDSKNVDALSYGLTTLCLPSRFAEKTQWLSRIGSGQQKAPPRMANKCHAQYVRKFSIGDGPKDWTSDYLIQKESGKMLGTLVAIAVSKMIRLESFVWDMPTGVLSDVFMALSSLEDENGQSKLEKVWIRWHDNWARTPALSSASSPTVPHQPPPPLPPPVAPALVSPNFLQHLLPVTLSTPIGNFIPSNISVSTSYVKSYALSSVEYPTFSILPPLKSLTVLDIDELLYLDEMSILIARSAAHLQELQVGISQRAYTQDVMHPWDGKGLQQVDHDAKWPGASRIPFTRLGGVLGVLVGRIHDLHGNVNVNGEATSRSSADTNGDAKVAELENNQEKKTNGHQTTSNTEAPNSNSRRKRLNGKLKLQKLSLERVPLSIAACLRAIDWSNMTSLTILNCKYHEALWKALKRQFHATPPARGALEGAPVRYHLSLKHLHTDQASPELLSFMKEAIAPNTMETIYLQDRHRTSKPPVTLDQVFKHIIRRQASSLRKLLIDSTESTTPSRSVSSNRWSRWAIRDQHLSFITSGKMKALKELGMVMDFKDWHFFVRQLPQLSNLYALYIPHMVNSRSPRAAEDLALHLVDLISLRRDIKLAYIGLWDKCFEILEVTQGDSENTYPQGYDNRAMFVDSTAAFMNGNGGGEGDDETEEGEDGEEEDEDDEDEEEDDDGDDDDDDDGDDAFDEPDDDVQQVLSTLMEVDGMANENDGDDNEEDEIMGEADDDDGVSEPESPSDAARSLPRLRLHKILYRDDRVGIFHARHGRI